MLKKSVRLVTLGKNCRYTFLLYGGFSVLILGLAPVISSLNPNQRIQAALVCESPEYNFGEVSDTDFPEHKFILENRGKKSISIQKVMPGCGSCIHVVDYTRPPISSGGKGFVTLQLLTGSLEGDVSREVIVIPDDPVTSPFLLTLSAKMKIKKQSKCILSRCAIIVPASTPSKPTP